MAIHKFAVGDNVTFSPNRYEDKSARGVYTIVRLLPADATPQYRIKAATDGRERVVVEDQLAGQRA
ncbi:MAG TPA: hypothetical protein VMF53_10540 [Alphaproteobacteria bacterium]|nr:hypothetical protein [Alphaproteobacteria bacterium]